ncbi:HAD family hydrolase [Guptibacillus algicola]|uniref:HAD family hydrolase n=1 Tax=Guptibacillus algicola TaxID=225844 RepID=UPI001CD37C2D|nr:HAD family hydrolase [Alkalihalobacillus algicola]MCA0986034.1 HAD family hydrolase [Alkalihalobacillus algicola]
MYWTHIYFDLDNTLYDHEKAFRKTMLHFAEKMLRRKKASVSPEKWFEVFKRYCDDYWDHYESGSWSRETYQINRFQSANESFNINSNAEEALDFQSNYEWNVATFSELFPGVEELLTKLSNQPVLLGIITNGSDEIQRSKIKELRLDRWFNNENIYISQHVGLSKPDPQIFNYAKEEEGNFLYVGDSLNQDVRPAIEAGFDVIYFNSRDTDKRPSNSTIPEVTTFNEVSTVILANL